MAHAFIQRTCLPSTYARRLSSVDRRRSTSLQSAPHYNISLTGSCWIFQQKFRHFIFNVLEVFFTHFHWLSKYASLYPVRVDGFILAERACAEICSRLFYNYRCGEKKKSRVVCTYKTFFSRIICNKVLCVTCTVAAQPPTTDARREGQACSATFSRLKRVHMRSPLRRSRW